MLTPADDYRELYERFEWQVPARYNMGVDVCDKWAEKEPNRLALIYVSPDGQASEFSFGRLRALSIVWPICCKAVGSSVAIASPFCCRNARKLPSGTSPRIS